MNIFIVIPVYNEEKHVKAVLKDVSKHGLPIVIVDDGSTDRTSDILLRFTNHGSQITKLTHKVNLGKGAAMKTGADYAIAHCADAVIFMDSDNQHKANDIPKFVKALNSRKYDVVFGSRVSGHGVPLVRFLGNKIASVLVALLFKILVSDVICGFRAMTKEAYGKIKWESSGYAAETEIVIKTGKYGLKYCEVPVETVYLDHVKGVTILDAIEIFFEVIRWRLVR